jgi:hypothetical protein
MSAPTVDAVLPDCPCYRRRHVIDGSLGQFPIVDEPCVSSLGGRCPQTDTKDRIFFLHSHRLYQHCLDVAPFSASLADFGPRRHTSFSARIKRL